MANILNVWDEETQSYVGLRILRGPQGPAYTLTETDKETIVNAVIEALPNGDEVNY